MTAKTLEYSGLTPYQATPGDAGLDLVATSDVDFGPGEGATVGTGTHVAIPSGHFGMLVVRSSIGKRGLALANGVGIIDAGYNGEIKAALVNHTDREVSIRCGERVVQLVVVPFAQVVLKHLPEPSFLSNSASERGQGGFGSTGRD